MATEKNPGTVGRIYCPSCKQFYIHEASCYTVGSVKMSDGSVAVFDPACYARIASEGGAVKFNGSAIPPAKVVGRYDGANIYEAAA